MRTALITIAHGRHEHLRRQRGRWPGCDRPRPSPIVVAMDDPEIPALVGPEVDCRRGRRGPTGLPLAAARNAGAEAALAAGAELMIFLDVDCLPSAAMIN